MTDDPILRIRSLRSEEHPQLLALWDEADLPCRPSGRDSAEQIGEAIRRINNEESVSSLF